jgi:hypothetical protein
MAGNVADLDADSLINADLKNRYQTLVLVVTDEEILGEITGAYNENQGLIMHDDFYADIYNRENMKLGASFALVHIERDVQDRTQSSAPVLGVLARLTGIVRISAVGEKLAKLELRDHFSVIRRGDRLISVAKPVQWSASFHPPEDLTAKVVVGEIPEHQMIGQGEVMLINKGKKDGIKDGFLFRVFEDTDPRNHQTSGVEPDFKGEVQIIHTDQNASIGYVLRNKRPILLGDLLVPYQTFYTPPPPLEHALQSIEIP